MSSYRIRKARRDVVAGKTANSDRVTVVLRADSNGLFGGAETELKINGKSERFDWGKGELLTLPKDRQGRLS